MTLAERQSAAAVTSDRKPFMIITSHVPRGGSAGDVWPDRARGLYVDEVRRITSTNGEAA